MCKSLRSLIKNLKHFIEMIMIPHLQNTDVTVLFDECHMLPKDVTMALLTITNPNKDNYNVFSYDGVDIEIDFNAVTYFKPITYFLQSFIG